MTIHQLTGNTILSLSVNFAYALGSCVAGIVSHSWWFMTLGGYYCTLSIARFSVLQVKRKSNGDIASELFARKITGILFLFLTFCLIGIVTLSAIDGRGSEFHEIVMITIAVYTFAKVSMAILGLAKSKRIPSPAVKTLRNISFADAFVSIYSLQRSMLVSFPGMDEKNIRLFNILTGTAVWLLILLLGINLIGGRWINVAKSKMIKANEKMAKTVVGSYKKIETAVVSGYTKIEDAFVDAYLTRDGETVEDAKARMKKK